MKWESQFTNQYTVDGSEILHQLIWWISPLFTDFFVCMSGGFFSPDFWTHQPYHEVIFFWWFQISFIFTPTWERFPFWLMFFKWVETTNQKYFLYWPTPYQPRREGSLPSKDTQGGHGLSWIRRVLGVRKPPTYSRSIPQASTKKP